MKKLMILVVLLVVMAVCSPASATLSASTVDLLHDKSLMDQESGAGFYTNNEGIVGDPLSIGDGYTSVLAGGTFLAWWIYDAAPGKSFSNVVISYTSSGWTNANPPFWSRVQVQDQNWNVLIPTTTWNDGAVEYYRWNKDTYILGSGVTSIIVAVDSDANQWVPRVGTVVMTVVPEPSALAGLAFGFIGLAGTMFKRLRA